MKSGTDCSGAPHVASPVRPASIDMALGCPNLCAGDNEGIVSSVADATRCGSLRREGGWVSGGTAIGDEKHFVFPALRGTRGGVAICADDPCCRGSCHTTRTCLSGFTLGARRPHRPGITLGSQGKLVAARKSEGDHDGDERRTQVQVISSESNIHAMY